MVAAQQDYESEFLQGLESGFFLRDKPDGYKDYDCPELVVDKSVMDQVNQILTPVQLAVQMLNNK